MESAWHEHPLFNGQYHQAVWAHSWVSSGMADTEPPPDSPVICLVCGRVKEDT